MRSSRTRAPRGDVRCDAPDACDHADRALPRRALTALRGCGTPTARHLFTDPAPVPPEIYEQRAT